MVSTYSPTHCGIGAYGEQSVAQLRAQGHIVDVASPDGQGNVDFPLNLRGSTKLLQLFDLLPYYDKVSIQYHWAFFYSDPFGRNRRWETLRTTLCFMLLFLRARNLEVVAHEIPYLPGIKGWFYKWQWKLAPKIIFHTANEVERFEQHYGMRLNKSHIEMRAHHEVFQKYSAHTRVTARRKIGVQPDRLIFLCIGFIQRHKGFHRAIQAFVRASLPPAELFVVGSLRVADSENQKYLSELRHMVAGHLTVHLVESFVSNEDFDTWITASDWVVFPYSEIWSSGVLARTRILQRPAIVAAVGGLPDQVSEHDLLFNTDEELATAFQSASARCAAEAVTSRDERLRTS